MFIRASCGCIVTPPIKPTGELLPPGMTECIMVQPCDSDGIAPTVWCFQTRRLETWKVIHDPSRDYKSNPVPSELTTVETARVIDAISRLVLLGNTALDIANQTRWIEKLATDMPQGIS